MNNFVFVLDTNRQPLKPCTPKRARQLLNSNKAAVFRQYPFVIILNQSVAPISSCLELRLDPGSKFTGFALVNPNNQVIWAMELEHRGQQISEDLTKRAGFRRSRRSRKTRYRQKRFNRSKPYGWLAPSLMHRVQTVETWIKRICRYSPVSVITIEKVKFDTQKLENPDIQGVEYQQGTLAGYTVREALLEHWGRQCAYCGVKDVPLQVEHIKPKSKGGTNRFSNLTLACQCCNQAKGNLAVGEFLKDKPEVLARLKKQTSQCLKDAAAVNSTRDKLFEVISESTKLPIQAGSGALAKLIRSKSNLPKAHWIDAGCNSLNEQPITLLTKQPLIVKCKGHGNRQSRRCNARGFPAITSIKIDASTGKKIVNYIKPKTVYTHAQTGDIVQVTIDSNRKHVLAGNYKARVKTPTRSGVEVVINGHRVSSKVFKFIHRGDGYDYSFDKPLLI